MAVFLPIRFAMTVMICMIGVMRVDGWFSPAQMDESQQARDSQGDQVKPSCVVPGKPRVRDCAGRARTQGNQMQHREQAVHDQASHDH